MENVPTYRPPQFAVFVEIRWTQYSRTTLYYSGAEDITSQDSFCKNLPTFSPSFEMSPQRKSLSTWYQERLQHIKPINTPPTNGKHVSNKRRRLELIETLPDKTPNGNLCRSHSNSRKCHRSRQNPIFRSQHKIRYCLTAQHFNIKNVSSPFAPLFPITAAYLPESSQPTYRK